MVLFLIVLLAACGDDGPDPAVLPEDFSVEYSWFEGSVAPPFHYEYDIEVRRDGSGTIRYRPDYGSTPEWVEAFSVSEGELEALYTLMIDQEIFDRTWREDPEPPVGGPVARMDVTAAGEVTEVPTDPASGGSLLEPVYAAIEDLVPQAIWDDLEARRSRFMEEYES